MKLVVSGSSMLLPGNKAWHALDRQVRLEFADYGNWRVATLQSNPQDALAVVLFLDDLGDAHRRDEEEIRSLLGVFLELLEGRLGLARSPTIIAFAGCDDAPVVQTARGPSMASLVRQWFLGEVYALASKYDQLSVIDLDRLFGMLGHEVAFDSRNWYVAHCRLSSRGLAALSTALANILERHRTPAAKVLVLDCDNTLWGGVVGEDGIEGLVLGQDGLGQAYADFQAAARALSRSGIVLAVASKNSEAEVLGVFDRHESMVLERADIVAWRINWQDKERSIQEIADELGVGLDSIVFWDDSPFERDRMRQALPEVLTVDVHADVLQWPRQLSRLDCFARFTVTGDDLQRTQHYVRRMRFIGDNLDAVDETAYLKSIRLTPTAHALESSTIARAAQLCGKTNQFNLRTVRHSAEALAALAAPNPDLCFLTKLEDAYGEHGLVGLVCLRELDADTVFLDTLLISCRVLGRHLETWMLSHALARARTHGYRTLVGEFIPSDRNQVAARFFSDHGFTPVGRSAGDRAAAAAWSHRLQNTFGSLYSMSTEPVQLPFLDIYESH
jgi:FkbH-like protein